ncbi:MAG: hypothetical protein PHD82_16550 [Candidatus Riflebacteria bacterium]|nr:hypothetical protein [Candidatus Riflebacteria bacterium]
MNVIDKIVLPFKWSEFGVWYKKFRQICLNDTSGSLEISDLCFVAGRRGLEGIKIEVELHLEHNIPKEVFLCGFIADLAHEQLFEPFIGNPDSTDEVYHASRIIKPHPGFKEVVELFIPEAGWVLPSIWRFLIQSLGLRPKGHESMPDIFVFAMAPGSEAPLLMASRSFDYYGNAARLKDEMLLEEFYRLLKLNEAASETEVQRAYINHCREMQTLQPAGVSAGALEMIHQKQIRFNRIKQGYQLWTEKLNQDSDNT